MAWCSFCLAFHEAEGDGQRFSAPFESQRLSLAEGGLVAGPLSRWHWDMTHDNFRASPAVTSWRYDNGKQNISGI